MLTIKKNVLKFFTLFNELKIFDISTQTSFYMISAFFPYLILIISFFPFILSFLNLDLIIENYPFIKHLFSKFKPEIIKELPSLEGFTSFFYFSFFYAIWLSSSFIQVLTRKINEIYQYDMLTKKIILEPQKTISNNFLIKKLFSFALNFLLILCLFFYIIIFIFFNSLFKHLLNFLSIKNLFLINIFNYFLMPSSLFIIFYFINFFSIKNNKFKSKFKLIYGSLFSTFGFIISLSIFSFFIQTFNLFTSFGLISSFILLTVYFNILSISIFCGVIINKILMDNYAN